MKIIRKGNLQQAEKRKEKERKKREAAEIAIFHCKDCGCKYSAKRDEYYIISALHYVTYPTSLVGLECPCCGELVKALLPEPLYGITREEILRFSRRNKKKTERGC